MSEAPAWKARPIFISSTFRDMHAERDVLRHWVFRELAERLAERFHHLEPIDLRWGVTSEGSGDDQARERHVLTVCLGEIRRSRPFLVGLLGDRYGWRPPAARIEAAAHEAGLEADMTDRSVTELEIVYGVLADPGQQRRSRFYFRKSLPYESMDPVTAAKYSERHTGEEGAEEAADRLKQLKQRIQEELPDRWREYETGWDPEGKVVTNLDKFRRMVVEDLWVDLEAETAAALREAPRTWQGKDRLVLEEFVEHRVQGFIGREQLLADLMVFLRTPADDGTPWGVCVTGGPGTGKSALFARLHWALMQNHRARDLVLLSHAAGVGPASEQVDRMLRRWVSELAEIVAEADPLTDESTSQEVEQAFTRFLGHTTVDHRVVMLIDALDRFEPGARSDNITWLPQPWPANARLVATAIPGSASGALIERPGGSAREIPLLGVAEAREIATEICRRHHRAMDDDLVDILLSRTTPSGGMAAGNPLWLTLAVTELNLLDADDFARLETEEFSGSGEEKLRSLLRSIAEELPTEVATLYRWMLDRGEHLVGSQFARGVLNLIAVSRSGWRESDLHAVFPEAAGVAWDDLSFATLRRSLSGHLVQRGADAQWDFFHAQLREAVLERNLRDTDEVKRIHRVLATHLLELPAEDPLHVSETMVHLMGADDALRAARYLGGRIDDEEVAGAVRVLADAILAGETSDENAGLTWSHRLLNCLETSPEEALEICGNLETAVQKVLYVRGQLSSQRRLAQQCVAAYQALVVHDLANVRAQLGILECHHKIGDILLDQGDTTGSLASHRAGLEVAERLVAQHPGDGRWQAILGQSHSEIGSVQVARGDTTGALATYQASLGIAKHLYTQDPSSSAIGAQLAGIHRAIGNVHKVLGDLDAAAASHEAASSLHEAMLSRDPSNDQLHRDFAVDLGNIGEIQSSQGDGSRALESYSEALVYLQRLAARSPRDVQLQRDLAITHVRIGAALFDLGNAVDSLSAYREAQKILQRLVSDDPANAAWQRILASIHDGIGDALLAEGDAARAIDAYCAALEITKPLAAEDPHFSIHSRDIAISHLRIGNAFAQKGEPAEALAAFRESLATWEHEAARDPGNSSGLEGRADCNLAIGGVLEEQGDHDGAHAAFREALVALERLVAHDASVTSWQNKLVVCHGGIGRLQAARDDAESALASYREAVTIGTRLLALDPCNRNWIWNLALHQRGIAAVHVSRNDPDQALSAYTEAASTIERLVALDPRNVRWQGAAAENHQVIGQIHMFQGNATGALASFRAVLEIAERFAPGSSGHPVWHEYRLRSLATVGDLTLRAGDRRTANELLRRCDEALCEAKRAGLEKAPFVAEIERFLASVVEVTASDGPLFLASALEEVRSRQRPEDLERQRRVGRLRRQEVFVAKVFEGVELAGRGRSRDALAILLDLESWEVPTGHRALLEQYLGNIHENLSDYPAALAHWHRCIELSRAARTRDGGTALAPAEEARYLDLEAGSLGNIGRRWMFAGQLGEAEDLLRQSLTLYRRVAETRGIANQLVLLAAVLAATGRAAEAATAARESLILSKEHGLQDLAAQARHVLEQLGS